ncbi:MULTISPECIES: STAS domain-containing protein [unclassified Lysinibacillus]|uniref:STAS domain-containing protein n=1 Tax=unclassified Lysinibacillus TaxID=2636778 RepID=UPI0025525E7A|nr:MULTISPECIES: STAS domain-containing protein [unclassified Lysinibacillus]MDM5250548.1 STAS domain-containing protein [Lysinibacillus sp. G4S2]
MDMTIHFKELDNKLYGFVEGEIDTFTASSLREELEAVKITEGLEIELNLSKVNYMDSTGLGIFVAFYKRASRENGKVKLVGLSSRLQRLFEITGLSDLMDIETDKKVELRK